MALKFPVLTAEENSQVDAAYKESMKQFPDIAKPVLLPSHWQDRFLGVADVLNYSAVIPKNPELAKVIKEFGERLMVEDSDTQDLIEDLNMRFTGKRFRI